VDVDGGCVSCDVHDCDDCGGDGLIMLCMIMLGLFPEAELVAFCGGSTLVCVTVGLVISCFTILLIL
jgi:uncharacterized membrane protein YgaE (UPF0421/DUF939 family)